MSDSPDKLSAVRRNVVLGLFVLGFAVVLGRGLDLQVFKQDFLRGEGDARSTAIYAGAANNAPEFYSLYRSLNAYKESFKSKDDILVVDPSADSFKYLKKPTR